LLHGNCIRDRAHFKLSIAREAIGSFIKAYCDTSPNSNVLRVPLVATWEQVYEISSDTTFQKARRKYYKNLKPAREHGLGSCDTCVSLKTRRLSAKLPSEIEAWKTESAAHYSLIEKERALYESRKREAQFDPQHYLSLIMDGTALTGFPHTVPELEL